MLNGYQLPIRKLRYERLAVPIEIHEAMIVGIHILLVNDAAQGAANRFQTPFWGIRKGLFRLRDILEMPLVFHQASLVGDAILLHQIVEVFGLILLAVIDDGIEHAHRMISAFVFW